MRGFLSIGLGLLLVLLAPQAQAQGRPLLVEGKTTLYQRVLSRPGASLHESPGGGALEEAVRPFDIFYVFAREGDWVEVAHAAEGPPQG
jgi:serine/threonine-protein kinase PpkA